MIIENVSERMEVEEETVLNGIESLTMFNSTNNTKLDPLEELELWNSIIVPEKDVLMDIPEELLDTDGLPPILDYKSVMHNLQKTIAIEHAKKVREGKESVNMNAQLREKYSDYNYHFPDRILNSGLSKKDFTAPFLIDVSQINQDMGKQRNNKVQVQEGTTVNSNEMSDKQSSNNNNNNKSAGTITTINNNNSNEQQQQSAQKRKEPASSSPSLAPASSSPSVVNRNSTNDLSRTSSSSSIITSSPTLFAMLEQPAPKRAKLTNAVAGNQSYSNNSSSILINNNISQSQMEPQEEEEDDFFPKIVNTMGSFQMNKDISQQQQQSSTNTTPTTIMQKANGTPQGQKVMRIPPRIQKSGEGSGNVGRTTQQGTQQQGGKKTKSVRGSGYLGCRQCGKTFPSNCDNLYRSHMLIRHSIEVTDAEIFSSKIQVTSWYKCRKCQLMVLNNLEDHQKKCLPDVPFENAFDPIHVLRDNMPKIVCGVCNESFGSRVSLRQHLQTKHPNINNKILLDPFYRCGMCLQNFSEAKKLIEHVHICSAPNPTPETTLEIAQKNLYCEICARKHAKIRETLFCYQAKSLLRCVLCMHVCQSRQNFFQHLKTFHDRRQVGLCCPFCNDNTEKQTREAFDHFIDNHFNVALKKAGEAAAAASTTAHRVARVSQVQNAVSNNSSNNNNNNTTTRLINSTTTITATNSNNNSLKGIMPKLIRPAVQQQQQQQQQQTHGTITTASASASLLRRSLPVLKPKSILPRYPPGTTQTIQIPASQVLQVSPSSGINLVSTTNGTLFTTGNILTRPVIINRGQLSNMPLQYAVVPAGSLSSLTSASTARPIKIAAVTSVNTSSTIQAVPTVSIQPAVSSTTSNSTMDEDSILGM